jgi:hypothetical protein
MCEIKATLLTDTGALFYPFSIILSNFSLHNRAVLLKIRLLIQTALHLHTLPKMSFWLNFIKTENLDMTRGRIYVKYVILCTISSKM